jgi:hypothetical protein
LLSLTVSAASERPADLAQVLEPLLGTPGWAVLDELFVFRSRVPLAHLLTTAAAVAGVVLPDEVYAAARRLPVDPVPPDWTTQVDSDEPPF